MSVQNGPHQKPPERAMGLDDAQTQLPPREVSSIQGRIYPTPVGPLDDTKVRIAIRGPDGGIVDIIDAPEYDRLQLKQGLLFIGIANGTGPHRTQADAAFYQMTPAGNIVYGVADGVGDSVNAPYASHYAVCELQKAALEGVFDDSGSPKVVVDSLAALLGRIHTHFQGYRQSSGDRTGTTVAVVVERDRDIHIASVGDSRIYGVKPDGSVEPLTRDDSSIQEKLLRGELTEAQGQLLTSDAMSVISMYLGDRKMLLPGRVHPIPKGEYAALLIATDSVTNQLRFRTPGEHFHPRTELRRLMGSDAGRENPARAVIDDIYMKPMEPTNIDNTTVIVRKFG